MYVCAPRRVMVAPAIGAPVWSVTVPETCVVVVGAVGEAGALWANAGAMLRGPPASATRATALKTRDKRDTSPPKRGVRGEGAVHDGTANGPPTEVRGRILQAQR